MKVLTDQIITAKTTFALGKNNGRDDQPIGSDCISTQLSAAKPDEDSAKRERKYRVSASQTLLTGRF